MKVETPEEGGVWLLDGRGVTRLMTCCRERSGRLDTIVWTIFNCSLLLGALGLAVGSRGVFLDSWAVRAFEAFRLFFHGRGVGDCGLTGGGAGGVGESAAAVARPMASSAVGRLRISAKLAW